ncbi:MAG: hypothetical protein PHQ91_04890 [Thermoanaerobaculaceae bacterium]|nr:hypothetical protein [Thermoanaerobaculaceae bacterium]TAM45998.1 MAG: hypothetical protein EPN53_13975 [Acidobacteriota bacterium]
MFGHLGFPEVALICLTALFVGLLFLLPACLVCRKAGYPAWLGVAAIVPVANILLLWFLALAKWPVDRGMGDLRRSLPDAR